MYQLIIRIACCWVVFLGLMAETVQGQSEPGKPKVESATAVDSSCTLPKIREELAARVARDQAARMAMIKNAKPPEGDKSNIKSDLQTQVLTIDRENKAWMRHVVEKHGWLGATLVGENGAHDAWLLVQHADQDLPFQKDCLALMTQMPLGEVSSVDIAYLTDRVLAAEGKLQRYGTQCLIENGKAVVKPVEDPDNLNRRREKLGLEPIEAYLKLVESMYVKPAKKPSGDEKPDGSAKR